MNLIAVAKGRLTRYSATWVRYDPSYGHVAVVFFTREPHALAPQLISYVESCLPNWTIVDVWPARCFCQIRLVAPRL